MLNQLDLQKVLFIDIETVSAYPDYNALPETWQNLWADKTKFIREREDISPADYYPQRAGIMAEFGKIVCISCGFFARYGTTGREFRLKSFYGEDEFLLLQEFADLLNKHFQGPEFLLCAHNGKEFDFPYLSRRMLVHGIQLPVTLNTAGKKPWEIQHLDTMELWKFGDYKHFTSLKLLAALFDIPTPKDDIDGSMVGEVFWKENDLDRISTYCQKDTVTVAQLVLRYRGEQILKDHEVLFGQ
jgi:predicted PolB exonuclease-like 3'-5' exonuclease